MVTNMKEIITQFRRDLHRIPELDTDLQKTRAYLTNYLNKLSCELVDLGESGFVALFNTPVIPENEDLTDPTISTISTISTIAFRADMDALPIEEMSDADYVSTHPGIMHACGHDGHMAILLGLATKIEEHLDELGDLGIMLIFQAAEETTGGAKLICDSGVFETYNVQRIYGLHLWPGYPKDTVICRSKEFMAGTCVVTIDIEGRSAHIGKFKDGIDALGIAADFIRATYDMEGRELDEKVFRLLKFGMLSSGTGVNIVASHAKIQGTLRTYDSETKAFLWNRMKEIAQALEEQTGAAFTFSRTDGYPPVVNPPAVYEEATASLKAAGFDIFALEEPMLIAEDFSYYLEEVPGLFIHLGTGSDTPLHTCNYEMDEDVLVTGVNIFYRLLLDYKKEWE
jgi:hippurate hydrolase